MEKCDLFVGDWVAEPNGPMDTNENSRVIEDHQNCMRNGRPDSGQVLEMGPVDAIPDLVQVEAADEVYHDEEFRSKIWKFPSHNFTLSKYSFISILWTTNGPNQYKNFDYVVIAGGKWFLKKAIYHENNTVTGCHNCNGKNLTEHVFDFMTNSEHKAVVFFRTTTPDHFENREWFSGGCCNRAVPFKEDQVEVSYVDSIMRGIELEEFHKAKNSTTTPIGLSLLRPDGHPGPYRQFHPLPNAKGTVTGPIPMCSSEAKFKPISIRLNSYQPKKH
ncbi:Protein trichome birefringence-like 26 [Glycine soja]